MSSTFLGDQVVAEVKIKERTLIAKAAARRRQTRRKNVGSSAEKKTGGFSRSRGATIPTEPRRLKTRKEN